MKDFDPPLTPELLLRAYASGIFPMAESRGDPGMFWVDPRMRGVLPINGFHISRSLARRMRKGDYHVSLNKDFAGVVAACAERTDTWISFEIEALYSGLHDLGHAHSLEVWEGDLLVGGVYGVALGGAFFGESMFSARKDGSKLALAHLTDHLHRCGFSLFDTQFITPHLMSLGAFEIPRREYRARLREALQIETSVHREPLDPSGHSVMQRTTQTS
ncbi:MAG: leucyl/phenylalanyl-tRNA--protein transferase [Pseudomonadota bacterium]